LAVYKLDLDGNSKLESTIEIPDILYCSLCLEGYVYLGLRQGTLLRLEVGSEAIRID